MPLRIVPLCVVALRVVALRRRVAGLGAARDAGLAPTPLGDAKQAFARLLRFGGHAVVLDQVTVELEGIVHLALGLGPTRCL